MEAYLEERVLGQELPVSATLLSRDTRNSISSAHDALSSFWNANRNRLDASFLSIDTSASAISVQIVSASELPASIEPGSKDAPIYTLAPSNASDAAIVLSVAAASRKSETALDDSELRSLGAMISTGTAGPSIVGGLDLIRQSSDTSARSIASAPAHPIAPSHSTPSSKGIREISFRKAQSSTEASESSSEAFKLDNTAKVEKPNGKSTSLKKSPFTPVTKKDALAFQRQKLKPVVPATVVAADEFEDTVMDGIEEEVKREEVSNRKEEQIKNLGSLFDTPSVSAHQDPSSELPKEASNENNPVLSETVPCSEVNNITEATSAASGETQCPEAVTIPAVSDEIDGPICPARKFKKVKRQVKTLDDEGYEQVDWEEVLVPITSDTQDTSILDPSEPASALKSEESSATPQSGQKRSTETRPSSSTTPALTAQKKGKGGPQKTLYSFFSKKK